MSASRRNRRGWVVFETHPAWSRHPQLARRSTTTRGYLLETGRTSYECCSNKPQRRCKSAISWGLSTTPTGGGAARATGDKQRCRPRKTSCDRRTAVDNTRPREERANLLRSWRYRPFSFFGFRRGTTSRADDIGREVLQLRSIAAMRQAPRACPTWLGRADDPLRFHALDDFARRDCKPI